MYHQSTTTTFQAAIVPCVVLLATSGIAVYQHVAARKDIALLPFFYGILFQMVPIAILKMAIVSNQSNVDIVAVLGKFSSRVLIMHILFFALRVTLIRWVEETGTDEGPLFFGMNVLGLIICCAILCNASEAAFSLSFAKHIEFRDIKALIVVSIINATVDHQPDFWSCFFTDVANTIEIVAFVPALWMVYSMHVPSSRAGVFTALPDAWCQKRALHLMVFLTGYYLYDDVYKPVQTLPDEPMFQAGHAAHFVMLLDFSYFFLSQTNQKILSIPQGDGREVNAEAMENVSEETTTTSSAGRE